MWHTSQTGACAQYHNLVAHLVAENVSMAEIARRIGTTPNRVADFLKRNGIAKPKAIYLQGVENLRRAREKAVQNSACERNRVVVLCLGKLGMSLNEIARKIGTNSRHVRDFLDRNGVEREYRKNYGGARSPSWKGGRIMARGYVKIHMPEHPAANVNGYVWEHRLVMEKMIGRYLKQREVVHHRNGIRCDNRPENLQLFSENKLHLAHELKGKVPKWTAAGLDRMRQALARSQATQHAPSFLHWREKLKRGVPPSRVKSDRTRALVQRVLQRPSQTEHQPASAHPTS